MINLKPNDILYLDELQRDYENIINYYNDLIEHMKEWIPSIEQNKHLLTKGGIENEIGCTIKLKNQITEGFIQYIMDYVQKEYGLSSLENYNKGRILYKYIKHVFVDYGNKYDNLHYGDIIKDISNELGIKDFDKAEYKDLQNRIINKLHYKWENKKIEIDKANKIKVLDSGFRAGSDLYGIKIHLLDTTIDLYSDIMSALNYITTGEIILPEKAKLWLNNMKGYTNGEPVEKFYTVHKINILGIESLRFYKNRNLEIKFINEESKEKLIRVLRGEF